MVHDVWLWCSLIHCSVYGDPAPVILRNVESECANACSPSLGHLFKVTFICIREGFHGQDLMVVVGFSGSLAVF